MNDFDYFNYELEDEKPGTVERALERAIDTELDAGDAHKKKSNLRHRVNVNDPVIRVLNRNPHKFSAWLVAVLAGKENEGVITSAGMELIPMDIRKDGGWMSKVEVTEKVPVSREAAPIFKNRAERRDWERKQEYVEVLRVRHAEVISGPFHGNTQAEAEAEALKESNTAVALQRIMEKGRKHQLMMMALAAPPVKGDISYWSGERERKETEEKKTRERLKDYAEMEIDFSDVV